MSRRSRRGALVGDGGGPQTVLLPSEIAHLLVSAREGRGLTVLDVHDRTGLPITLLEAIESGDYHLFPDAAFGVSTLRRYADFLLLPTPDLAASLLHHLGVPTPSHTGTHPAVASRNASLAERSGLDDASHLRAFHQTAVVPALGRTAGSGSHRFNETSMLPVTSGRPLPVSPVTQAVDVAAVKASVRAMRRRRRRSTPLLLRLAVWILVLLLAAGGAGMAADHWRPQWLSALRLPDVERSPSRSTTPTAATKAPPATPSLVQTSTAPGEVAFSVDEGSYTVTVGTSAPCWVQVTTDQSVDPVLSGIEQPGWKQSFPATGKVTVQLGASGALVVVTAGTKTLGAYTPTAAPVTITFSGAGAPTS